jgi:hypothetical protein
VLHAIGQMFLFAVLVIAGIAALRNIAVAAFGSPARGASGRTGTSALRSPGPRAAVKAGRSTVAAVAHPGNRQIRVQARADRRLLWEGVKSTDWLERQRHQRGLESTGGTTTATDPAHSRRSILRPFAPGTTESTGGGTNGANGGNGSAPVPPPPSANGTGTPARPGTPGTTSTNGGTVTAGTSTASAEKLIEGINEIYAKAVSGNIFAKREAIKAAHEASVRFSAMAHMLARTMAEPGSNYGPEITEPCAKAGQNLQATAMSFSEADAALTTLINMTLGDLAASPRQAPHHTELTESGAR